MAKKPVSNVTNVNEIEKTWKVAHASHRMFKFLTAQGIHPVNSMKFGKGIMHLYPRTVLNNAELKLAYERYCKKDRAAPPKKIVVPSNGMDYSAVLDSITTVLMRLEGKVDALHAAWTTPATPKVWDEDQKSEHGH